MRTIALLLLLLFQPPEPPPAFSAAWIGNHSIRLAWQQPAGVALTCLHRGSTLIQCYPQLAPGPTYTTLGNTSPLDASAHPAAGDVYTIVFDGAREQTTLGWVLWIPQVTKR